MGAAQKEGDGYQKWRKYKLSPSASEMWGVLRAVFAAQMPLITQQFQGGLHCSMPCWFWNVTEAVTPGGCSRSFQDHEGLRERPQEINIWCVRLEHRNVSTQNWGRSVSSETCELRPLCHEEQFHGQNIYRWDSKSREFRKSVWDHFFAEHWWLSLKIQMICNQALISPLKFKIFQQNAAS